MVHDREQALPPLKVELIQQAESAPRIYTWNGRRVLTLNRDASGNFPTVECTEGTNGDWRLGWWGRLAEDAREFSPRTLAYRVRADDSAGEAIPIAAAV
jgi:hypothetical protein